MESVDILTTKDVSIIYSKKEELLKLTLINNTSYDKDGFKQSLNYIKNTWTYFKDSQVKATFLINLNISSSNDLPLDAYISLIEVIKFVNDILITNCHCIIILTKDPDKLKGIYNFLTKLWCPPEQRPIGFFRSEEESGAFVLKNKLV
jgi:hypothetical protein